MIRIALVLTAVLGLAACETVQGAGKDIQKAGTAITSSAKKVQSDM